jgi:hypothetical protein
MASINKTGCWLLAKLGTAKQHANRPYEWCSFVEMIITADYESWQHFLSLRDHPDAQPEMQVLAKQIKLAIQYSVPELKSFSEWHLPYDVGNTYSIEERKNISVGLCAGVSYVNLMEVNKALALGKKLQLHEPSHYSPYEHQAQCMNYTAKYFNFQGWKSYRFELEQLKKEKQNDS